LLDGASLPLQREPVTIPFKDGAAFSTGTRKTYRTSLGPVIARANGKVYVFGGFVLPDNTQVPTGGAWQPIAEAWEYDPAGSSEVHLSIHHSLPRDQPI